MGLTTSNQTPTHFEPVNMGNIVYMIVPPDGGWGWVIIFVSFTGFVILDGVPFGFTYLRNAISDSLSVTITQTTVISSIFVGTYFTSGVFACAVGNRYGFRILMMAGGLVVTISFIITATLKNLFAMYVVYGFIGGIGAGFIMISLILPPGFYFNKKRPLAAGLTCSGTGLGAIIAPTLIKYFVEEYGWRNTLFIEAAFLSICIILGALIRPLEPLRVNLERIPCGIDTALQDGRETELEKFLFSVEKSSTSSTNRADHQTHILFNETTEYPTISDIVEATRTTISLENATPEMVQRLQDRTDTKGLFKPVSNQFENIPSALNIKQGSVTVIPKSRESLKTSLGVRPLYRDDIWYHGSLLRLTEYTEKDTILEYHLDVTHPATQKDINEELEKKCVLCSEAVQRGLSTLINIKFLKSPTFLCFSFCGFFVYFSFHGPSLYIAEKLEATGYAAYRKLTIGLMGLGIMTGRILSGITLILFPHFSVLAVVTIACFAAGLSSIAIAWYSHIVYCMICMTIFGFTVGIFLPLRSLIIVDFMGLDKLTTATGMIIIFQGVGALLGPPTAEYLKEMSSNTNAPFYVTGSALLLSSLLLLLMKVTVKWELRYRRGSTTE